MTTRPVLLKTGSAYVITDLPHTLRCSQCGLLTTRIETTQRIFNTGACGHCGGQLEVVRETRREDEE